MKSLVDAAALARISNSPWGIGEHARSLNRVGSIFPNLVGTVNGFDDRLLSLFAGGPPKQSQGGIRTLISSASSWAGPRLK